MPRVRKDQEPAGPLVERLGALDVQIPPESLDLGPRGRSGEATVHDPLGLVRHLLASGRFCSDTRAGRIFHRGSVSLREMSPASSLHVSIEDGTRMSAHIDRMSPLTRRSDSGRCRYSVARIAVHLLLHLAADLARLALRRGGSHRVELACSRRAEGLSGDAHEPCAQSPGILESSPAFR